MADALSISSIETAITADYNGWTSVEVAAAADGHKGDIARAQGCTPTQAKHALSRLAAKKRSVEQAALIQAVGAAVSKLVPAPEVEIGGPQGRDVIVIYPNGKPERIAAVGGEVARG